MKLFIENHLTKQLFRTHIYLSFFKLHFKSWSIVFFGSDNFSLVSLEKLYKNKSKQFISNLEVVTISNTNPVYRFAVSKNIKTYLWPPVLSGQYDFGVIVSFGKLIPKNIISQFPLGIINVHASLLPRWRGGMPIIHAIKNGDKITGVTLITINHQFDSGDILTRRSCSIGEHELMPSVFKKLSKLGSECLLEEISSMPECLKKKVPQPTEGICHAPILKKDVSFIKWNEMNAIEIYNLYRALFGLYDLTTTWHGVPVKVVCVSLNSPKEISSKNDKAKISPGSIEYNTKNECLTVQCKDRTINICTVKLNGKLYGARNFYRGFLRQVQKTQWIFGS